LRGKGLRMGTGPLYDGLCTDGGVLRYLGFLWEWGCCGLAVKRGRTEPAMLR
jgi:hypothetical protein